MKISKRMARTKKLLTLWNHREIGPKRANPIPVVLSVQLHAHKPSLCLFNANGFMRSFDVQGTNAQLTLAASKRERPRNFDTTRELVQTTKTSSFTFKQAVVNEVVPSPFQSKQPSAHTTSRASAHSDFSFSLRA